MMQFTVRSGWGRAMVASVLLAGAASLLASGVARADDEPSAPPAAPAPAPTPDVPTPTEASAPPHVARLSALREHVEWLTSPERMGRLTWEDRVACADYIQAKFKTAGLVPPPGMTTMLRDGEGRGKFARVRNVCGWLSGASATTDPANPGSYIIVSAHYDHLGARRGTPAPGDSEGPLELFAGADDNASGTAAMLELAHALGKARGADAKAFPHSILFVAFDLEEQQLLGSRRFAKEPPLPLKDCWTFITIDQLGRSLGDMAPGSLFVQGGESAPALHEVVDPLGTPKGGFVLPLGIDFQPGYSDYVPFKERSMPYLFVTSGACSSWHKLTDTAERIEWPHLTARTDWCITLVRSLAALAKRPTWVDTPKHHPEELARLHAALTKINGSIQANPNLPPNVKFALPNFMNLVKGMLSDGVVSAEERRRARTMALMLFQVAMRMGGG